MAQINVAYKDKAVFDAIKHAPHSAFIWYLIAGIARFKYNKPIITREGYKKLKAMAEGCFPKITHAYKINNDFEDHVITEYFDWDRVKGMFPTVCTHIDHVYPEQETKPQLPVVVEKPKEPEKPKQIESYMHAEAKVYLDTKHKDLDIQELLEANNFQQALKGNNAILVSKNNMRSLLANDMYSLIHDLRDKKDINVYKYVLYEVMIDSSVKDVWNIKHTA